MKSRICLIYFAVIMTACAQKATKAYTSADVDALFMQKKLHDPLRIEADSVFVDARSDFDFALLHSPRAIHVKPSNFTETSNSGVLKTDLIGVIRHLAILGISSNSKVIVLSGGRESWPDAGYVAWAFLYIGMHDVQLVDQNALNLRYYNVTPPPRPNAPMWEPKLDAHLIATDQEFKQVAAGTARPAFLVLYVGTTKSPHGLHLDWSQFFNKNGRPNFKIVKKLQTMRINLNDRIVVVSDHGIRSGAVAYALTTMGFTNVGNLAKGY